MILSIGERHQLVAQLGGSAFGRAQWREYSDPAGTGYTKFRYLLLHVKSRYR